MICSVGVLQHHADFAAYLSEPFAFDILPADQNFARKFTVIYVRDNAADDV